RAGQSVDIDFQPDSQGCLRTDARPDAAQLSTLDREVQLQGVSPERLVPEGVEPERLAALIELLPGALKDDLVESVAFEVRIRALRLGPPGALQEGESDERSDDDRARREAGKWFFGNGHVMALLAGRVRGGTGVAGSETF